MDESGSGRDAKRLKSMKSVGADDDAESTDFKLAVLASLRPESSQEVLLDYLLAYDGNIEKATAAMNSESGGEPMAKRKRSAVNGYQASLDSFATKQGNTTDAPSSPSKTLTKKGKTLHLYSPKDIETHTPCSIIHNFLGPDDAEALTKELLAEEASFIRGTFQLFDRTVQSPHTWKFYVDSADEVEQQKKEYVYDGVYETNVAQTPPVMLRVSSLVRHAVNDEVRRRTRDFQPGGQKLKFQSPDEWRPNASFVNCYDGGKSNVGYHADQFTYLGPRAVIGSLSLGVTREFRVRRIVPASATSSAAAADAQGQIAIHLPHNSLLVMHADMQENWKHSIAPAASISPHPLAGNKRLNVTYRWYRPDLHPRFTPKCRCGIPMVLRCVQKRQASKGRYMWMCHANYTPGKKGCAEFVWAEFDVDGRPSWAEGYKGNANVPTNA